MTLEGLNSQPLDQKKTRYQLPYAAHVTNMCLSTVLFVLTLYVTVNNFSIISGHFSVLMYGLNQFYY